MGKTANVKQAARVKARARRVAMDVERDARDRRVEEATAEALVLLEERAQYERNLARTNREVGAALQSVLAEGIAVGSVAKLVELDVSEVRRLVREAPSIPSPPSTLT